MCCAVIAMLISDQVLATTVLQARLMYIKDRLVPERTNLPIKEVIDWSQTIPAILCIGVRVAYLNRPMTIETHECLNR